MFVMFSEITSRRTCWAVMPEPMMFSVDRKAISVTPSYGIGYPVMAARRVLKSLEIACRVYCIW